MFVEKPLDQALGLLNMPGISIKYNFSYLSRAMKTILSFDFLLHFGAISLKCRLLAATFGLNLKTVKLKDAAKTLDIFPPTHNQCFDIDIDDNKSDHNESLN